MHGTERTQNVWLPSIAGAAVILFTLIFLFWRKNRNLPPGPWGVPFFGFIPFLGKYPEQTLIRLVKKYGNVFSFYMGNKLTIVLGNYNTIQQSYVKIDDFNGRPDENIIKILSNDAGVVSGNGEFWKVNRRFTIKTFRDFGMGKLSLEPQIQEEIRHFLETLAATKGSPNDPLHDLSASAANVICILLFGHRFEYSDKLFILLCKILSDIPNLKDSIGFKCFFSWTRFIPIVNKFSGNERITAIKHQCTKIFEEIIQEHMNSLVDGSCSNYIDAYLNERKATIEKTGSEGHFSLRALNDNIFELFSAGMNTITSTLRWMFVYLMFNLEVQKKIQKEIEEVVGGDRLASTNDRPKMVYSEAVLFETHRLASIVPLNIIHSNNKATTLAGFRIPKKSYIVSLLKAVHQDPSIWKDPDVFRPERFIRDGKLEKSQYVIPFSIGKRACLGEGLAKMELFLYMTAIVQRFNIEFPKDFDYSLKLESGVVRAPKPFQMRVIERPGYSSL